MRNDFTVPIATLVPLIIGIAVIVILAVVAAFLVPRRRGAPPLEAPAPSKPAREGPSAEAVAEKAAPQVSAPPAAPPVPRRGRVRSIGASVARVLRGGSLTPEQWEELEEVLLRADVGVVATQRIVDSLRKRGVTDGMAALRAELLAVLGDGDRTLKRRGDGLSVWLVTGVNGVGKTTTIGKLAAQLRDEGRTVVLAAADTFRAAADHQLERWSEMAGAEIVKHAPGADPAAVVFDALAAARARDRDVLIVDTAGRLQTKKNLMDELGKIRRVLEREAGPPEEVLLVLDATTGQNGVAQARAFAEVADVTGLVLTKLDGTAKGGIVIAVQQELGIPVKLVGLGEAVGDLAPFDPEGFIDDLLEI
ncbi:MAG: signal recognition particle-docking protein FtsY [Actinomycetota bacterium]